MGKAESASACHHVTLLSREHDRLVGFLVGVLDLKVRYTLEVLSDELAELMGWTLRGRLIRSTLIGGGDAGMIEIVDAAGVLNTGEAVVGRLAAGPFQLCLMVADLRSTLDRARAACVDQILGPMKLTVGGSTILAGVVYVAGTRFHLTQRGEA